MRMHEVEKLPEYLLLRRKKIVFSFLEKTLEDHTSSKFAKFPYYLKNTCSLKATIPVSKLKNQSLFISRFYFCMSMRWPLKSVKKALKFCNCLQFKKNSRQD